MVDYGQEEGENPYGEEDPYYDEYGRELMQ